MDDMLKTESIFEEYIADYRILTELASSASSRIFLAEQKTSNKVLVVVKLFYSTSINTPQEIARFLTEIQALRQLQHPSILPILDAGIDKGTPYIVIPHLTYGSLFDQMQQKRSEPMPIEKVLTILLQIGQALHYAHQRSIFHGNLKPRNILFAQNGQVLLTDFTCAATHTTRNESSLINPDSTFYIAPEQLIHPPDALSDQYALGCLAYELFTTLKPFKSSLSTDQPREDPPTPTQLRLHLPLHIEHAILKAIAKEPEQRYQDIPAFLNALSPEGAKTPQQLTPPSFATPLHEEILQSPVAPDTEKTTVFSAEGSLSKLEIVGKDTLRLTDSESENLLHQAVEALETDKFAAIPALSSPSEETGALLLPSPYANSRRHKLVLLTVCIAIITLFSGLLASSFLFPHPSTKTGSLIVVTKNTPTAGITHTITRSASPAGGSVSAASPAPTQTVPPSQSAKPTTINSPASTQAIATRPPIVVTHPLQITPTSFTPTNCVVDNNNYRCTTTLQLSGQFQRPLQWQVTTKGIKVKLNSFNGTINPGQNEQLIIYIHNACPQSGSLTFSGGGYTTVMTWNC